jgi:membrane-associated phospholipid phosphatase
VTHLQERLIGERAAFLHDPSVPGSAQSIGAFASLHVSVWCTAALGAHLLRLPIPVRVVLWVLTGLTMLATVYFGWHYLLDDAGGVAIAVVALAITRAVTGGIPRLEAT